MAKKKTSKKKAAKKVVKKKKATKKRKPAAAKPVEAPTTSYTEEKPSDHFVLHNTKDNLTKKDKTNSLIFIGVLVAIIILLIIISPFPKSGTEGGVDQRPEISNPHLLATFPSEIANVGDILTLTIEARNVKDMAGFQMEVSFNSDMLEYKKLSYDDFIGGPDRRICVPPANKGSRIEKIACARIPSTPGSLEGVSGEGNLVFMDFEVVGRGNANIQIENVNLINIQKTDIAHNVIVPQLVVR